MEPTGRANARPMTGAAKSGTALSVAGPPPDCAALHPGYGLRAIIASASSPLMLACNRMKSAGSPAIALSSKAR